MEQGCDKKGQSMDIPMGASFPTDPSQLTAECPKI